VTEFCHVQNSLCVQVLRSPILSALVYDTPAAVLSQALRCGTRNGITELSQTAPRICGRAAIGLGIGPYSSLSFSSSFLSSPNLSGRRLDVYHTSTHAVALVRILTAGLNEMCCTRLAENTGCKKSPSGHHRTTLSGYTFAAKARIDNRKKLLSNNISSTCPHKMVNFGPLAAEISWRVWGTPANFKGFRVLAALLHGTPVLGVSQTLRR